MTAATTPSPKNHGNAQPSAAVNGNRGGSAASTNTKAPQLPKLTGKYASIAPVVPPHTAKLQWTMFTMCKNMSGMHDNIVKKVAAVAR